jgi:hypothetical protein
VQIADTPTVGEQMQDASAGLSGIFGSRRQQSVILHICEFTRIYL